MLSVEGSRDARWLVLPTEKHATKYDKIFHFT